MVSYEKIIRQFLKFHLVFKWELFVSFHVQMVPPFYSVCYSAGVLCQLTLVLLSMDSYETATTDNGLKNQSYMDTFAVVPLMRDHKRVTSKTVSQKGCLI